MDNDVKRESRSAAQELQLDEDLQQYICMLIRGIDIGKLFWCPRYAALESAAALLDRQQAKKTTFEHET